MPTPRSLARRLALHLAPHLPPGAALLDPACGEGALLAAALEVLGGPGGPPGLHGIELDPGRAQRAWRRLAACPGAPRVHLRVGSALAASPPWPLAAVLANPPWVSYSGRGAAPRAERAPRRGGGWPSLHGAFLERIAEHVARTGLPAAVLAPAGVVELERYAPLRRAVEARARLLEPPLELGEHAFPGVVGPAVLLLMGPRSASPVPVRWSAAAPAADLLRLLERFPRLPAGSFADPGVHSGNAAARLLAPAPAPGCAPVRRGRDLHPYVLSSASQWLDTRLELAPPLRFRRGPLERYTAFSVLLRQTADRPIAALHEPPGYFRNSLLACRAVPGLDPAALVAVLNGPLAAFWHRTCHRDARQRTFPQVKVGHLAAQPMPFVARAAAPVLHDALAARVRALSPHTPSFTAEVRALEGLALDAFDLPRAVAEAIREALGRG